MALVTGPRIGKVASALTDYNYATAIAVAGDTAYVGEYSRRLTIVDVSDPRAPVLRGQLALTPQVSGIATDGACVYVTGFGGQLQVVDATDPAAPVSVASLPGNGRSVAADGTHAYVTTLEAGGSRLRIFDVTNPAAPVLKSDVVFGSGLSDIQVLGSIAYVCSDNLLGGGNWLRMFDISNPAAPALLGSVSLGSATYRCFTTDGTHACIGVGDGSTGSRLLTYDVADPSQPPVAKGVLAVHGIPAAIERVGDTLYLTFSMGSTGVLVLDTIDVSDMAAPALREYTSLGREDGVLLAQIPGHLIVPRLQFDVYATDGDLLTAGVRVSAGLMIDSAGRSSGGLINGITFGAVSGEGISSQRWGSGGNRGGLDFYTAFINRMAITNDGRVGIGHVQPQHRLDVNGSVAGIGAYNNLSDGRYKDRVLPITNALQRLERLRGVTFEWRRDARPDLALPGGPQLGLIAQDVEAVFPEAVTTRSDGSKAVAYSALIPVLIEALKQQQREIEALRSARSYRRPERAWRHIVDVVMGFTRRVLSCTRSMRSWCPRSAACSLSNAPRN